MQSDNWFVDASDRLVLGDFGAGRLYRQPPSDAPEDADMTLSEWPHILFQRKEDALCCNGMAWDPHVARLSRVNPPSRNQQTLESVYLKCDLFGVGRMHYNMWECDAAFPSTSVEAPNYDDSKVCHSRVAIRDGHHQHMNSSSRGVVCLWLVRSRSCHARCRGHTVT